MDSRRVIDKLKSLADADYLAGMTHFAMKTDRALGVTVPLMRKLAKEIGTDHKLALELWETGIHEARVVATLIDDPKQVTKSQMSRWVRQIDNWGVCDACCGVLFDKTPFAWSRQSSGLNAKKNLSNVQVLFLWLPYPSMIKRRLIKNSCRSSALSSVTQTTGETSSKRP